MVYSVQYTNKKYVTQRYLNSSTLHRYLSRKRKPIFFNNSLNCLVPKKILLSKRLYATYQQIVALRKKKCRFMGVETGTYIT